MPIAAGIGLFMSPAFGLLFVFIPPIGICFSFQAAGRLTPMVIWLAIPAGHATRCVLSVLRFRQQKWRNIRVEGAPAVSSPTP